MGGVGACPGAGAGNAEKDNPPRLLSGAGGGNGPWASVFQGHVHPEMISNENWGPGGGAILSGGAPSPCGW